MAWEGEGPSGHPAEPERAVRDDRYGDGVVEFNSKGGSLVLAD